MRVVRPGSAEYALILWHSWRQAKREEKDWGRQYAKAFNRLDDNARAEFFALSAKEIDLSQD